MRIDIKPVMAEVPISCANCMNDAEHHVVSVSDSEAHQRYLGPYCLPCIHLLGRAVSNAAQKVG